MKCNRCNHNRFKTIVKNIAYRCRGCGQAFGPTGERIDDRQAQLFKLVTITGGDKS